MFLFSGNAPALDVLEGQVACVTGAVSEFFGMTQISAINDTVDDLGAMVQR